MTMSQPRHMKSNTECLHCLVLLFEEIEELSCFIGKDHSNGYDLFKLTLI